MKYLHIQKTHWKFLELPTIFPLLLARVFSFQNNPKNLDQSYKADLDLWDYLGRVKLIL